MSTRWVYLVCGIVVAATFASSIAGAAVPNPNVLWWKFDEGSGTTATDSSGNGRVGVISGAQWVSGGVGGVGSCLEFLGTGQKVEDDDGEDYLNGLEAITIVMWVKARSVPTDKGFIIGEPPDGGDNVCTMRYDAAGASFGGAAVLKMAVTSTPGGEQQLESSAGQQITGWHHVAMTWTSGGLIEFYSNGKLDTPTGRSNPNNAGPISGCNTLIVGQGGKDTGNLSWDGFIDDVRIYDTALTAAQITELYNSSQPIFPKASNPSPADGALGVNSPLLQWTKGDTAVFHNVYFGTTPELTEANLVSPRQTFNMYWHIAGLEPGVTYYWRIDEVEPDMVTTHIGDVWSFTAEALTASAPNPADGARGLFPAPTLTWLPGKTALQHQIYFSDTSAEVADGAAAADKGKVAKASFSPGALRSSSTYYWRVDEIRPDGSVEQGPVWSFTTADGVTNKIVRQWWSDITGTAISALTGSPDYPNSPTGTELLDLMEGPVDWADNYGTRLYGWLTPPESGEYTFWIAGDDAQELWLSTDTDPANVTVIARVATYTASREWTKEAGQQSAPITLQAGQKYYIEALGKEGSGGDSIAVSWQGPGIGGQQVISAQYVDTFALPPLQAFSPSPTDGAVDAPQSPILSWSAGELAQQHEVYFGDDQDAIAAADSGSPLFKGRQAGTTWDAGDLEWSKTYYWRVDEIAGAESWKGSVWSFTTADFIPVDDMESYTDDEGSRIYETWVDGYTDGLSGSVVGYFEAPFAERTIVHGGKQSMPFEYNNVESPFFSEAYRELSPVQNWTVNGVDSLSLWFQGRPVDYLETAPGAFIMSASGVDIWGTADEFRFAYKRLSGNATIVAKVESIDNTNGWAKAGVMIRESLDPGSKFAYVVGTPAQGVSFGWRQTTSATCGSATQAGLTMPQWVKLTRTGDAFTAQYSDDGQTWTDIKNADGTVTSTTIAMTGSLYIGLCVTSHNATAVAAGEFSGVATTGGVSGAWQMAEIGVDHPANSQDGLYVVVQDSANKTAMVTHPDPGAVNVTDWTEWKIPLSEFTGVNLAKVKLLYVGVGDRKAPQPDGAGLVFIDDIRVVRPAAPTP